MALSPNDHFLKIGSEGRKKEITLRRILRKVGGDRLDLLGTKPTIQQRVETLEASHRELSVRYNELIGALKAYGMLR